MKDFTLYIINMSDTEREKSLLEFDDDELESILNKVLKMKVKMQKILSKLRVDVSDDEPIFEEIGESEETELQIYNPDPVELEKKEREIWESATLMEKINSVCLNCRFMINEIWDYGDE